MAANIAFTDAIGSATLSPLGGVFNNWVTDPFPLDDAVARLGSGQVDAFEMRDRDGFSFDLLFLNTDLPIARRLITHLWRGGLVAVDTGIINTPFPAVYLNVGIATTEDGERIPPVLTRDDPSTVDYRLALHLEQVGASASSALRGWYLRNLASDADLSTMPEGTHETSMNPYGEADPRETFDAASTGLADPGGTTVIDPLIDVFQLIPTRGASVARLTVTPTLGPVVPGEINWATTAGRFATPALAAQTWPGFTARLHQRTFRSTTGVGVAYYYAILSQWRPGSGVVAEWTATVPRIAATGNGGALGWPAYDNGSPLLIVVDALDIEAGDRLVLEVHITSCEDTLASLSEYLFDGPDDVPVDDPPYSFAARIEMPDFVLA